MINEIPFATNIFHCEILNHLIDKFGFEWYLEVGSATRQGFDQINCKYKVGVDPAFPTQVEDTWAVYKLTSDEFFKNQTARYDICFVDGLHHYEQVIRDMLNAWNVLNIGGFIMLHDCYPISEESASREPQKGAWNGDCYRAVVWFRDTYPEIYCRVVFTDNGLGILYKNQDQILPLDCGNLLSYLDLDYTWLIKNLDRIGLYSLSEFNIFVESLGGEKNVTSMLLL